MRRHGCGGGSGGCGPGRGWRGPVGRRSGTPRWIFTPLAVLVALFLMFGRRGGGRFLGLLAVMIAGAAVFLVAVSLLSSRNRRRTAEKETAPRPVPPPVADLLAKVEAGNARTMPPPEKKVMEDYVIREYFGRLDRVMADSRKALDSLQTRAEGLGADSVASQITNISLMLESVGEGLGALKERLHRFFGEPDIRYSTVAVMLRRLKTETGAAGRALDKLGQIQGDIGEGLDGIARAQDEAVVARQFGGREAEAGQSVLAGMEEEIRRMRGDLEITVKAFKDVFSAPES